MPHSSAPAEESVTIALQQQVARLQALLEATRQIHAALSVDDAMALVPRIAVRELEVDAARWDSPRENSARFPLYGKDGQLLAELIVDPGPERELNLYEIDFLEGLALQAAVAIENARYHERNVQWVRVEQDLAAARAIQRSLVPQKTPSLSGYGVAVRSSACYEVGGDYADILPLESGEHVMVVADVAGKGLASALVGSAFRAAFRAMAQTGLALTEIAARLNQQHWEEGPEARRLYVTAIFLKLDTQTNRIKVVNAGHNPGLLVENGASSRLIGAGGRPLGLLPNQTFVSETYSLEPGARLLLYTDGLTDACPEVGDDEFGLDRLRAEFEACPESDGEGLLDCLWQAVATFSGNREQQDDMTALVLRREVVS
jgi:serine phosphatase RsbU (regulator of sigma subunit)